MDSPWSVAERMLRDQEVPLEGLKVPFFEQHVANMEKEMESTEVARCHPDKLTKLIGRKPMLVGRLSRN